MAGAIEHSDLLESPTEPDIVQRQYDVSNRADGVVQVTIRWLERAVIGLNFCPFAKSVHVKNQIRYLVSDAEDDALLLEQLQEALVSLAQADPLLHDTTLLIAPKMFDDFFDFNDFLARADRTLRELNLEGVLQIASFHPNFQFAGTSPDDITNHTNRAPYPTLHLIREASIDRAVAAFPEAEMIYERNMQLLESLGKPGWEAVLRGEAVAWGSSALLPGDVDD